MMTALARLGWILLGVHALGALAVIALSATALVAIAVQEILAGAYLPALLYGVVSFLLTLAIGGLILLFNYALTPIQGDRP